MGSSPLHACHQVGQALQPICRLIICHMQPAMKLKSIHLFTKSSDQSSQCDQSSEVRHSSKRNSLFRESPAEQTPLRRRRRRRRRSFTSFCRATRPITCATEWQERQARQARPGLYSGVIQLAKEHAPEQSRPEQHDQTVELSQKLKTHSWPRCAPEPDQTRPDQTRNKRIVNPTLLVVREPPDLGAGQA